MTKNLEEFDRVYRSEETFTGFFDLRTTNYAGGLGSGDVMDSDFMGRVFENCLILGGDFASGIFNDCTFNNCIFLESALVGCNFENCSFKKTEFLNIQISLSIGGIKACKVEGLSISNMSPFEDVLRFAKKTVFGESGFDNY
jgi:uncharacterized protein YjbI with pentapeptide repeats